MVIKEGRITEGIMTRIIKDFGTVLIMDLLENKPYVRFLIKLLLILEKKIGRTKRKFRIFYSLNPIELKRFFSK